MVRCKPLSLHDQRLASFLSNQNERHHSVGLIDVEQHAILTKQPQFPLGHWIRAQRFHLLRFGQRIGSQIFVRSPKQQASLFPAKPAQVCNHRLLQRYRPRHNEHKLEKTRIIVKVLSHCIPSQILS